MPSRTARRVRRSARWRLLRLDPLSNDPGGALVLQVPLGASPPRVHTGPPEAARARRGLARARGAPPRVAATRRGSASISSAPRRAPSNPPRMDSDLRGVAAAPPRPARFRGESVRVRRGSLRTRGRPCGPPKVPSSSRPYGAASRERARRRGSPARSRDDAARDAQDPRAGAGCRRVPAGWRCRCALSRGEGAPPLRRLKASGRRITPCGRGMNRRSTPSGQR
jgi:hypothetical protein